MHTSHDFTTLSKFLECERKPGTQKNQEQYQLFFHPVPRLSSQRSSLEKEASMNAGHVAATDWETRGYELNTRDIAFAVVATNTQC